MVGASLRVSAAGTAGVPTEALQAYMMNGWEFPCNRGKSRLLYKVFDDCRRNADSKLKCSAAEMLGLYALLRHWAETQGARYPTLAQPLASFLRACEVLDVLIKAKEGASPMAQGATDLRAALARHIECHLLAFGNSHVKPKMCWLWDIAEHLARDPFVLDCWIVERLHLKRKQVASSVLNTRVFERSVLAGCLNIQHHRLQEARRSRLGGKVRTLADGAMVGDRL